MEMLLSIALLLLLYSKSLVLQIYLLPCLGCIPCHSYLIICKNSLFDCMIYAHFQVVLLHSFKHKSKCVTRQ